MKIEKNEFIYELPFKFLLLKSHLSNVSLSLSILCFSSLFSFACKWTNAVDHFDFLQWQMLGNITSLGGAWEQILHIEKIKLHHKRRLKKHNTMFSPQNKF